MVREIHSNGLLKRIGTEIIVRHRLNTPICEIKGFEDSHYEGSPFKKGTLKIDEKGFYLDIHDQKDYLMEGDELTFSFPKRYRLANRFTHCTSSNTRIVKLTPVKSIDMYKLTSSSHKCH